MWSIFVGKKTCNHFSYLCFYSKTVLKLEKGTVYNEYLELGCSRNSHFKISRNTKFWRNHCLFREISRKRNHTFSRNFREILWNNFAKSTTTISRENAYLCNIQMFYRNENKNFIFFIIRHSFGYLFKIVIGNVVVYLTLQNYFVSKNNSVTNEQQSLKNIYPKAQT